MPSTASLPHWRRLLSITVLIDLDETLLSIDIDVFVQDYLKALGTFLNNNNQDETVQLLSQAALAMIMKSMPGQTLEQTFDNAFYPQMNVEKNDLWEKANTFYGTVFPDFRTYASPKSAAVELVESAFSNNHQVVIATNPCFPRTATLQRLQWAALDPQTYPFQLISTYETFHFCKPHTAYYAEVLAQLGWSEQPAVMIGNSWENDILPASKLGLPTFWVTDHSSYPSNLDIHPDSSMGSLDEAITWVEDIAAKNIDLSKSTPEALTAILKSTPAALSTLCADLTDDQWKKRPPPDKKCMAEIICHLRDVEIEVNLTRINKVMNETNPFLPGASTDAWAQERQYYRENGASALSAFVKTRSAVLNTIVSLTKQEWHRSARHAIFGPTELIELIDFIATHDKTHIHQLYEILENLQKTENH